MNTSYHGILMDLKSDSIDTTKRIIVDDVHDENQIITWINENMGEGWPEDDMFEIAGQGDTSDWLLKIVFLSVNIRDGVEQDQVIMLRSSSLVQEYQLTSVNSAYKCEKKCVYENGTFTVSVYRWDKWVCNVLASELENKPQNWQIEKFDSFELSLEEYQIDRIVKAVNHLQQQFSV